MAVYGVGRFARDEVAIVETLAGSLRGDMGFPGIGKGCNGCNDCNAMGFSGIGTS